MLNVNQKEEVIMKIRIKNLSYFDLAVFDCDPGAEAIYAQGEQFAEPEFKYEFGYRRIWIPMAPIDFFSVQVIQETMDKAEKAGREDGILVFKDTQFQRQIGFFA